MPARVILRVEHGAYAAGDARCGRAHLTCTLPWSRMSTNLASAFLRRAAATLCVGSLLMSCGGGGDEKTGPILPATVATVSVTAAATQIAVGGTTTVTAVARDATGAPITGRTAAWTSLQTSMATVNASGVVMGVAAGSATIRATIDGVSGSTSVSIIPVPVASVTIAPLNPSLRIGEAALLSATARDAQGAILTGRTVTWVSQAPLIATVNSTGLVTAVAAGSATISATIENVVATTTVEVTAPIPASLEIVGGNNQQGLSGRPLADSVSVRVRTSSGQPVANATVSWSPSGGTVSSATTSTDALGMTRVQWTPATGSTTLTASMVGLTPASFSAVARIGGTCALTTTSNFSLGATDYALSLRPDVPLRIAVLFVDYPGLPATETATSLMTNVVDPGLAMLRTLSYNRIDITAVSFPTWYRMPKATSEYNWTTYAGHRQFLLDVISVSDASVDFSTFDALYVFSPAGSDKVVSPTFNGGIGANVMADGRNFGNAVTFGNDARTFGPSVLVHETLHMLGLVDLYAFTPAGGTNYAGNQFKFTGAWTLMSNVFRPGNPLGWE